MYHAHVENMLNHGSYEKVVSEMFKVNNLPQINIPVVPQSDSVIAKITEIMERTKGTTQPSTMQTKTQHAEQRSSPAEEEVGAIAVQAMETETNKQTDTNKQTSEHHKDTGEEGEARK